MRAEHSLDVLLPVRGETPWLTSALQSLADQQRRPDHVLLVDDGLADRSSVVALGRRLFGDAFVLLGNEGRGISSALNTAVAASEATWVARMDADDVAHPLRFAHQLEMLQKSPEVAGCGTQVRLVDGRGRVLGQSRYPVTREAIGRQLLKHSCFAHPSLVLRRDALLEVPYRTAMDGAEDVDLVLRLVERWPLLNLEQPLLDYRIHVEQANFRGRARQAALQELAFRLADARAAQGLDPLDVDAGLVERFLAWRLETPGYAQARQAMTALRYMKHFLGGGNLAAAAACLQRTLLASPWRPDVLKWVFRVHRRGPGALREDVSPFDTLNDGGTSRAQGDSGHA